MSPTTTTSTDDRTGKVRLKDIARLAEVSISTVSLALSGHPGISDRTRRRISEICRTKGYVPRARTTPEAPCRALFLSAGRSLRDGMIATLLDHLLAASGEAHIRLEVAAAETQSEREESRLAARIADSDGVLLCGLASPRLLAELKRLAPPLVILGRPTLPANDPAGHSLPCVVPDEIAMGREATRWLIAQGHRQIGFACQRYVPGMYNARFCDGYRLALLDAGLPIHPLVSIPEGAAFQGHPAAAAAYAGRSDRPTAYVIPEWSGAQVFLDEMRERGAPVDPRAVVRSTPTEQVPAEDLALLPHVAEDFAAMARAALGLLQRVRTDERLEFAEVVIRHLRRNLAPWPSEAGPDDPRRT